MTQANNFQRTIGKWKKEAMKKLFKDEYITKENDFIYLLKQKRNQKNKPC